MLLKIVTLSFVIYGTFCQVLYEGDPCRVNRQPGRCIRLANCNSALDQLEDGIEPKICRYYRIHPIVCCVDQNEDYGEQNYDGGVTMDRYDGDYNDRQEEKNTENDEQYDQGNDPVKDYDGDYNDRQEENNTENDEQYDQGNDPVKDYDEEDEQVELHEKKCQEFTKEVKDLKIEAVAFIQVVGGTDAKYDEYPHMALLGFGEKDDIHWRCGGSLISHKFILTAAHCLRHPIYGRVQHVRLGDYKLDNSSGTAQDFQVNRTFRHPDYNPPKVYNDIALLELKSDVKFSETIKPACLHSSGDVEYIPYVTATGWGLTQNNRDPSNTLQTVQLDIFTPEECNAAFKGVSKRRIPDGILDKSQICAGGMDEEHDTCQGDSGGPLQWKKREPNSLYKIIGVTSFGKTCGVIGVPAIYTRVDDYIPWIEDIAFSKIITAVPDL